MNLRVRRVFVAVALAATIVVSAAVGARAYRGHASRAGQAAHPSMMLYSWGSNAHGELGVVPANPHVPTAVPGLPDFVSLAAGFNHSLALEADGTLWAWGDNANGQLGDGTTVDTILPVKLNTLHHVKAIAAGDGHSLALLEDGTVWAWGNNGEGELGLGSNVDTGKPTQIPGLANVISIAAGGRHSLALLRDGRVMLWGANGYGQLCDGSTTFRTSPIALTLPPEAGAMHIKTIAAGQYHTLTIDDTGHVWSCGWNVFGQLGNGSNTKPREGVTHLVAVVGLDEVTAVAAGHLHSLALRKDGSVYAWGYNTQGQLGNEEGESHVPRIVQKVAGAVHVTAGATTSLVILSDRTVMAWGANAFGVIGNNSTTNANTASHLDALRGVRLLAAGGNRVLALAAPPEASTLHAAGMDDHGQLGPFASEESRDRHDFPMLQSPRQFSAGWRHSLAVGEDNAVYAWGDNSHGQLGNGARRDSSAPVRAVGIDRAVAVAAGEAHSVALRADGTVWAWGSNERGQLGNRSTADSDVPLLVPGLDKVVAIAAGKAHTLALRFDRTVWTWGADDHGQLGVMGGGESRFPVHVDKLYGVRGIAAGTSHSLAVRYNGAVYAWGDNHFGQLGVPDIAESRAPVQIEGLVDITFVASGHDYAMAIRSGGTLWMWGQGSRGQLGLGRADATVLAPAPLAAPRNVVLAAGGAATTMAVQIDNRSVWIWGDTSDGKGAPSPPTQVPGAAAQSDIAVGDQFRLWK